MCIATKVEVLCQFNHTHQVVNDIWKRPALDTLPSQDKTAREAATVLDTWQQ